MDMGGPSAASEGRKEATGEDYSHHVFTMTITHRQSGDLEGGAPGCIAHPCKESLIVVASD